MNSVFSAFKSSKSDGSIQSNKGKKPGPANSSSYANLRHIREIGSSAKMSSFVGNNDDDDIAPNLRLNKCSTLQHSTAITATTSTPPSSPSTSPSMEQIIPETIKPSKHQNECDSNTNTWSIHSEESHGSSASDIKSATITYDQHTSSAIPKNSQSISSSNSYTHIPCTNGTKVMDDVTEHSSRSSENKENTDTTNPSTANTSDSTCLSGDCSIVSNGADNLDEHQTHNDGVHTADADNEKHTPILSAASNKKLNKHSESNASATSNKSTSNRFYKRLSISGIGSNPLPSVHGRSTSNSQNGSNSNCGTGETKRTRISTHQRNLSLDFR